MINTGTTADLLEKNQTTYQEQKRNSDSVTYQRDVSVSNDLMRNYADKGLFIEQHLADTEVNDTNVNVNAGVDTNPSETTLQQNKSSYKISAKGKIMIVVYALVVATIIALIAVNASVLRSMQENIHAKEDAVTELKTQTQTLKEELEEVSSEETIIKKAMEMGMTK